MPESWRASRRRCHRGEEELERPSGATSADPNLLLVTARVVT
jgi:hypothetical protein